MDIIIRKVEPSDAERLIPYIQRLVEEPRSNIELSPREFTLTAAQEKAILAEYARSNNSVYLVAETEGKIVGILHCIGSPRQAVRHTTVLGMSVDRAWRGRGIGSQLLSRAVAWAKGTGVVSRVELNVFERNEVALHLYRKFGFEVEGRRRKSVFRDGEYLDDLIMALLL